TTFDPGAGANSAVRTVVPLSSGKVLIGGDFATVDGVIRNHIARLNADGSLDTAFNPGTGASATVYTIAVQVDGKVIIGGAFNMVNGVARNRIARLNANGALDTSFNPGTGANNWVDAVAVQTDGKVVIGGLFSTVNGVSRNRIARLNADGTLDTFFNPGTGANAVVNAVALQADGKVLVGGAFATMDGVARNRIARLDTTGALDTAFDPGAGADDTVWTLAVQADGKVLIGGEFTTVDGTGRNRVARLNGDGTLDVGFDPGTGASNQVQAVVPQPDGKVLVGGYFTTMDGTGRNRIARLNANGSLDTGFAPGTGADSAVRAVALQPDGKVIIGGAFATVNGVVRTRIARLDATGMLDVGFDPGTGANDTVVAVAVHNGKVIVGGYFTSVNGTARNRIARLNDTGTVDTGFNPGTGADNSVLALAVQPDGKVIIAGNFTTFNGVTRNRIARLNADGTLDTAFAPGAGANLLVRAVAVQPDNKVIIGGSFTTVGGVSRNRIARLNADGTLDTGFVPGTGANSWVDAVALQSDGKVLIGGAFTTVDGVACNRIARLKGNGSVDTAFITSAGADDTVYDIAVQPDGKVLIGGDFNRRVARLNGATPPAITSGTPPATATTGVSYNHTFTARGYPFAPRFYVTDGSLPAGLTLDAATGVLAGQPTTAGNYIFTVSACNHVAPCDTQAVNLAVGGLLYLPLIVRQ
ncbi:MAG: putative Ig domain-containing protein, partial [Chloroflexi bacterium]|nr:putative Ig domain-containing protein [Chloroflexota bacterium]